MRSFGVKVLLLSIRYTRLHLAPKNEKQATAWQRLRQSYSLCLRLRSLRGVWKRRFLPPGTVWLRWEMLSKTGPSIFWSTRALWKRREPTKQLSFWKGLCTLTLCCSSSMQFYLFFLREIFPLFMTCYGFFTEAGETRVQCKHLGEGRSLRHDTQQVGYPRLSSH